MTLNIAERSTSCMILLFNFGTCFKRFKMQLTASANSFQWGPVKHSRPGQVSSPDPSPWKKVTKTNIF